MLRRPWPWAIENARVLEGHLAEGEGFEPPRAWRPLRFSGASFGVLRRAVEGLAALAVFKSAD
jgi:hypothetical protein